MILLKAVWLPEPCNARQSAYYRSENLILTPIYFLRVPSNMYTYFRILQNPILPPPLFRWNHLSFVPALRSGLSAPKPKPQPEECKCPDSSVSESQSLSEYRSWRLRSCYLVFAWTLWAIFVTRHPQTQELLRWPTRCASVHGFTSLRFGFPVYV